jgi:hypothetical protein
MATSVAALAAILLAGAEAAAISGAAALEREILALAASGDPERLARARDALPPALSGDPDHRGPAAARALAGLLQASDLRERSAASPDGAPGLARARAIREEALDELRLLVYDAPADPAVLRALALYCGLDGRPAETARIAAEALEAGVPPDDPWLDLALVSAGLRGRTPSEKEPVLAAFVARRGAILGARMSLARARLALGDPGGAVEALDALLATDPDHAAAREMKADLLSTPPADPMVPHVPATAPPPTAPGWLPRKKAAAGRPQASPPGA